MQVYVPRARRQVADSPPEVAAQNTPPKSSKIRNSSPSVVTPRKKSASKSANNKSKALCAQSLSCDSDTSSCDLLDDTTEDVAEKDIVQSKETSGLHETASVPTPESACVSAPKFVPQDLSGEEDSWDALYDDSGECLDPSLVNEVRVCTRCKSQLSLL
jgi:hypothetical protein